jgi:hypothetical protein
MLNINCPLCGGHLFEGDPCGTCHAPAAVVESIIHRDRDPRFVGVLGPSGVGKTVYLGMLLDMLSRGASGLHGMAKGPYSLTLHRNLIMALEQQRFPAKTPNEADRWDWIHCEVSSGKRGQVVDIVTPDVAGEAVMAELDRPKSNPTIRALISRCAALVVLADIVQVVVDGQAQELFAMQLVIRSGPRGSGGARSRSPSPLSSPRPICTTARSTTPPRLPARTPPHCGDFARRG